MAAPDDNTDLDFSTTLHGLVPKGPNDGTFLKADGTWAAPSSGGPEIIRKTAEESVNNSTTLQNDDHLLAAIAASATRIVRFVINVAEGNTAADIKVALVVPSGASVMEYAVTFQSQTVMEDGGASLLSGMPLTYWAASATQLLTFDVIVINSTAAGNIQLQWAQNTAHA